VLVFTSKRGEAPPFIAGSDGALAIVEGADGKVLAFSPVSGEALAFVGAGGGNALAFVSDAAGNALAVVDDGEGEALVFVADAPYPFSPFTNNVYEQAAEAFQVRTLYVYKKLVWYIYIADNTCIYRYSRRDRDSCSPFTNNVYEQAAEAFQVSILYTYIDRYTA